MIYMCIVQDVIHYTVLSQSCHFCCFRAMAYIRLWNWAQFVCLIWCDVFICMQQGLEAGQQWYGMVRDTSSKPCRHFISEKHNTSMSQDQWLSQCMYTVNHKKGDILFLTIILTNLSRFL